MTAGTAGQGKTSGDRAPGGEGARRAPRGIALASAFLLLSSCAGAQSAFSPFGVEAEGTLALTWAMTIALGMLGAATLTLAVHAWRSPEGSIDHRKGMRVIAWLGAILPAVFLGIMLSLSLPRMRAMAVAPDDLRIKVDGEQYWWRVNYRPSGGPAVETANEIRVPVGRTVAFDLGSPDVIHSFWIPGLAGKLDMVPGRRNELVVRATRPGTFRGVCAEFCGLSHTHMAFDVVAMAPGDFDRWLADLALPASPALGQSEGARLFQAYGCGGCHVVRGHGPGSPIGPDLTHFGARRSLGAGTLPMRRAEIAAFIRDSSLSKPGSLMPAFPHMSRTDADRIAEYLQALGR